MKNLEIARIFDRIADILEIEGENPFRIRAYRRAAQNLEALVDDIESIAKRGDLTEIPGIGKDLSAKIIEYLQTGSMKDYEVLKAKYPDTVIEMLSVPGIGPKKVKLFYKKLGIKSIKELEEAIKQGKLTGLPGIREKTLQKILKGIEIYKSGRNRRLLGHVYPVAQRLKEVLISNAPIKVIEIAGSFRRRRETVKDLDILVISEEPKKVIDVFVELPLVGEVLSKGTTRSSILTTDGLQIDLRVLEEESFGSALQYFTGSKQHNIHTRVIAQKMGLTISEYGVFEEKTGRKIAGKTEEEVYEAIGLTWIPPELREDRGEIEAALNGKLPELITEDDIRGDLHIHTNWSDGTSDIREVVNYARLLGLEYIAITDHSKSLTIAKGLDETRLLEQIKQVKEINASFTDIEVLCGIEVDILEDGSLDISDEVLKQLDIVVASIHTRFNMKKQEMTKRIVNALKNPYVNVLGHPTGRMLGERDPYEFDLEEVIDVAIKNKVAFEVNAYPQRLDLSDVYIKRVIEAGCKIAINTDSHVPTQMSNIKYGVFCARRGWAEKKDCINSFNILELKRWLSKEMS